MNDLADPTTTSTFEPTDPTGRYFLSYRSTRVDEAELLVEAQHDVGIPTWQDRRNLEEVPTEAAIREVLNDSTTAGTLLWITPEVATSKMIQRVEAPWTMLRHERNDGFVVVPVAAGGLDYNGAADVLKGALRGEDLRGWNLRTVTGNPIDTAEALAVARWALDRRLGEIHRRLPAGDPLQIVFNTREPARWKSGRALTIDWSARCQGRPASPALWSSRLLPALDAVADAISLQIGDERPIEVTGKCAIAAAVALGTRFLRERGLPVAWLEPGRAPWTLAATPVETGLMVDMKPASVDALDLAVLVSVSADVRPAFEASRSQLPEFRAIVSVFPADGSGRYDIPGPSEAVAAALQIQRAMRDARREYWELEAVHLFMAVPVGLAVLVGQLLNTFGDVQTYEHLPGGAGRYQPAATLRPSG